jgi:hypothetical protein
MDMNATEVQSSEPSNGAKVRSMNDLPPVPPDAPDERIGFTVRVTPEQHADLLLVAKLWNAMDKAMGHRRPRKWKLGSVVATYIASGLDRFWDRAAGGRPETEAEREAFIREAVKKALEERKASKKK